MADPFVAEIRIVPFNFAPRGWAFCNGQLLPISQNTALFSLLGTTYGGNGQTNFSLPNFQGSAPIHWGDGPGLTSRGIGEVGGQSNVTFTIPELPAHTHTAQADATAGGVASPAGGTWGKAPGRTPPPAYSNAAPGVSMHPLALGFSGQNFPHNNLSPHLVLNFIFALQGVYPPRS